MTVSKNRIRLSSVSIDVGLDRRIRELYKGDKGFKSHSKYIEDLLYESTRNRELTKKISESDDFDEDWED